MAAVLSHFVRLVVNKQFEEWEKYEEHLDRQMPQSGSIGKPLGEAVRAMTDEQRAMLAKLAEETRRLS